MVISCDGKLKFVRKQWTYEVNQNCPLIRFVQGKDIAKDKEAVKAEFEPIFKQVFIKKTYTENEFKDLYNEYIRFSIRFRKSDIVFDLVGYFINPLLVEFLTKKGITIVKTK